MSRTVARRRDAERWIARIRFGAFVFALFQVVVFPDEYPPGYEWRAWVTTATLGAGALAIWALARRELSERALGRLGAVALVFDTAVIAAYVLIYSFEHGTPVRQLFFIALAEAAVRYGIRGGVALPLALTPVYVVYEWIRDDREGAMQVDLITLQIGLGVIAGLIVGWLVRRLNAESAMAEARADESERLRAELARRADLLDATNRCAGALSSSLELEEALRAFVHELHGVLPFDRMAIVLVDDVGARVAVTAGAGAATVFPPGSRLEIAGSTLEQVLGSQETLYRPMLTDARYTDEYELRGLGLGSRVAVPLRGGSDAIGMLSLAREEPDAFNADEIELAELLGRLVATATQNIRAYESERRTAEELRRLSSLRADFVSLVSHELRSPMAAVIGSARTLEQRWRELTPEQRDSFLALIADETTRLAELIRDVLDTSRIEAGTFTFSFDDVDVGTLVRDSVAAADVGQDEVSVRATVREPLPLVRADGERLRQVLTNLIDNAVKYSPPGAEVEVVAFREDGRLRVEVRDDGPGVAPEDQHLIFEKFGRAASGAAKPGTGLGLFIARSIAEAHGGSIAVQSTRGNGSTFTLELPLDRDDG